MGSLFEPAQGHELDLPVTSDALRMTELQGKVVLVLGDAPVALEAIKRAVGQRANVMHASLNRAQQSDCPTVQLVSTSYQSFVYAFQQTKDRYGALDIVIAGFAVPQADNTAAGKKHCVEATLTPMINSVKLALYHFRRDLRSNKADQRFVALIETVKLGGDTDPCDSAIGMAALGMYRSAQHHWNAAGAWFDFVAVPRDASLHETELAVSAAMRQSPISQTVKSSIFLVSNDSMKTLPPTYGQIVRPPAYSGLDDRLRRIVSFKGAILNLKVRHSSKFRLFALVAPLTLAAAWWIDPARFAVNSIWVFIGGWAFVKALLA